MGVWDCFCLICGGPVIILDDQYDTPNHKWIGYMYGLGKDGKLYDFQQNSYDNYGGYTMLDGRTFSVIHHDVPDDAVQGVAVHQDCYKLLRQKLGVFLTYNMITSRRQIDDFDGIIKNWPYPGERYMQQDYDWESMMRDNPWLGESPMVSVHHANVIMSLWKPFLKGLGNRRRTTRRRKKKPKSSIGRKKVTNRRRRKRASSRKNKKSTRRTKRLHSKRRSRRRR